jgi:hypothetical protein
MLRPRPIIVSGTHKSGSTWVGNMICRHTDIVYLHEPFSPLRPTCACGGRFERWFTHVTPDNEALFLDHIRGTLSLSCPLHNKLRELLSGRHLRQTCVEAAYLLKHRLTPGATRALMKDPIALFSLDWLAERFGAEMVVLIRHPAAFVNSLLRSGWTIPYKDLHAQPALLAGPLADYAESIEFHALHEQPVLDQAILFWNIAHRRIRDYQIAHPDWIFARHEDLTQNPLEEFRKLYARLTIPFGEPSIEAIREYTRGRAADRPGTDADDGYFRRDSSAVHKQWQTQLTAGEIDRIRAGTEPLWREFYAETDW